MKKIFFMSLIGMLLLVGCSGADEADISTISYKRITLKNGLWYDQVLGINDSIKKKIFYDITKYQDETGDAKGAYSVIAQRYEIPEEAVRSIAVEGALKLWPMP